MQVTYNDFTFDTSAMPEASTLALLSRGLSHYLGNEVSARVGASFKKDAIEAHKAENPGAEINADLRKALEARAIPDTDSEVYLSRKAEIVTAFQNALREGSVGVRERGASADPFETEVNAICKSRVVAILRAERKDSAGNVYKLWTERRDPKGEDQIQLSDKLWVFSEMLASHLAKHRDVIEREAKKRLAEREASKAKAVKSDLEEAF